ncbi:MAG: lipopolysaccharide biosynthesis protein, partial [Candidatus Entotheonellia bacterium]
MSGVSSGLAAQGTLQLMLGRLALFGFGYLVTIILARRLGPVEYGVYGIILSVLVWVEQIGRFGIPEATAKLAPEDEARRPSVEQTAQTLLMLVFLCLFILMWLSAPTLARLFRIPEAAPLFRLACLDIPVSGLYFTYQGILAGRRDFGAISGGLALYGLTKLIGIAVALLVGLSIFGALMVNVAGTVGALLFLSVYVSHRSMRPSFAGTRIILPLALPIGVFLLALQILLNLDLWSLKILAPVGEEIIGMYVAALNIARMPALAFAVINGVVLPSLSLALARQDMPLAQRYVRGAGRFLWVTLLPSSALLALTAEDLMVLLYSSRYAPGASFLALQVFGFGLFGCAQVFSEMVVARGNPFVVAVGVLVHIPVALLLNLLLISHLGGIGAAAALLLTGLSLACIGGFWVYRRFGSLM